MVRFKPAGVPMRLLKEVSLGLDELEAMSLADQENLSQEEVGELMNISRATAGRILAEARRKTAEALVHGWAIRVKGETVEILEDSTRAPVSVPAAEEVANGDAVGVTIDLPFRKEF